MFDTLDKFKTNGIKLIKKLIIMIIKNSKQNKLINLQYVISTKIMH